MRTLFKLFVLLFFALPLALAGLIYLAIDTVPSINRAAEITPTNIARAKRILDQNDPRKLKPGARRTISVSQNDLDLAANYLARQYAAGGARVRLDRGSLNIGASLKQPTVQLPIYINLDTVLAEDGALPRIASLRVGQISTPPGLAYWVISRLFALTFNDADINSFRSVIKKVTIADNHLAITY